MSHNRGGTGGETALRDFEADEALLSEILDDVIRADGAERTLELRDRALELARRARAGEERAGDELAEIEGLGEVVVRSQPQAFDAVVRLTA